MGRWLKVNGEGIYGATHWEIFGEGPTKTNTGHLAESKDSKYTEQDFRFTKNRDALYCTALVPPSRDLEIRYLNEKKMNIKSVELLGYDGVISFSQTNDKLIITRPADAVLEYAWVFKIQ